jgi:ABC-2 type transport system ATP-binding protein
VLAAAHLTKRFGSRLAVDDVSIEVGRGEIVALLGPNGAGKTTTLRMLAGLIAPTRGRVEVDGLRLTRRSGTAIRRRIGFLTEAPGLWDRLTVRENLSVYAGLYELDLTTQPIDRLLDDFELLSHAGARAAELSKGMRQKVALARALLHDPHILLLDEPTSSLDPVTTRMVRTLLDEKRRTGCTIIVSTHNLDEAGRLADRVAVLRTSLLAMDTPASLRQRLATGRVIVKVQGEASRYRAAAELLSPGVEVDGSELAFTVNDLERGTPLLVNRLIAAGAAILEVRPEMPVLEDVYLHLVTDRT